VKKSEPINFIPWATTVLINWVKSHRGTCQECSPSGPCLNMEEAQETLYARQDEQMQRHLEGE